MLRAGGISVFTNWQALRRMDEGDYGVCASCQEWISYARLEQKPEADLCGDCAR